MLDLMDRNTYSGHTMAWLGTLLATLIGSSFYVLMNAIKKKKTLTAPPETSWDEQGVKVPGKKNVYKSGFLKNTPQETVEHMYPEVRTLFDAFLRGLKHSNNGKCLGHRPDKESPYEFQTYKQVWQNAGALGSAFITKLGLKAENTTNIGIYAKNCTEYAITIIGCVRQSMVSVPLYDTLGAEAVAYIVGQTEIEVVIVEDEPKIKKILDAASKMPTLKYLVILKPEAITQELLEKAQEVGIQLHNFYELVVDGANNIQKDVPPKPEDTYMICYTSGTTGNPKGVIITHRNIVSTVSAFIRGCAEFLPELMTPENCVTISYLPLSHVFEQCVHWSVMMSGGSIGYFRGIITELPLDMQALKPTIFPSVPRLLNRFYDGVQAKLAKSGYISQAIFKTAYSRKLSEIKRRIVRKDSVWDRLVFNKIQEQFGGRVMFAVTGSAPISAEIMEFCRVTLGCVVMEGYGQTENCAFGTGTWLGDYQGGHVGGPAVCTLVKLDDVPDMNYCASEGKGEIMLKGPGVTKGYYKDPEKTAELFDKDGFLHTGDIGEILPNGTLRIIDRKKNILKLAQGEYVAPEKIENVYARSSYVQQVYVDGDSLERFLVAIVVPEVHALQKWYKSKFGQEGDLEKICELKEAKELILKDMQKIGKENKLSSLEQVQAIYLEHTPFSVENGLLTPTLKSKRPQLRQMYKPVMAELYKNSQ